MSPQVRQSDSQSVYFLTFTPTPSPIHTAGLLITLMISRQHLTLILKVRHSVVVPGRGRWLMVEVEKLKQEAECLKSWFSGGLRTQEAKHQSGKLLTQSSAGDIELMFLV